MKAGGWPFLVGTQRSPLTVDILRFTARMARTTVIDAAATLEAASQPMTTPKQAPLFLLPAKGMRSRFSASEWAEGDTWLIEEAASLLVSPSPHLHGSFLFSSLDLVVGQLNTWDDQIKLPRRSRSLDDERSLPRFDDDLATTLASKGEHSKIHAGIPERLAQESPTAEFDLSYIYSLPAGPGVMPKTADGSALFDPISSNRSSVALSFVQIPPHAYLPSGSGLTRHGSGASSDGNGERISITTSLSGEDAFEKCLRKMDHDFVDTKEMWTFRKERSTRVEDPVESTVVREPGEALSAAEAESPATGGMIPGSREIWSCIRVGRLEITRHKLVRE
jgi:hypothetical protein